MLIGDYLIDDRLKNGASNFKGELIRFGWDYENKTWNHKIENIFLYPLSLYLY